MAGQWGDEQISTQNLLVVDIRAEENLMLVRGAVPGSKQGVVILRPATKR
jgi:large subunit ribosomal protein L3